MFTAAGALKLDPAATLATLKRMGVDRVRLFLPWGSLTPQADSSHEPSFDATDPSAYPAAAWASYDTVVRTAKADGIGVDVLLGGPPPLWAAGRGAPAPAAKHPNWKPRAEAFEQFVTAVGKRFSGHYVPPGASSPLPRVDFWSIWNEPNIGANLAPEMTKSYSSIEVAPRTYRGLVQAAWTALHATGHGHDTVLIGELAPAGSHAAGAPGLYAALAPLQFLRALYCVNASYQQLRGAQASERGCPATADGSARFAAENPGLFKASGFAVHPYPFTSLPPNQPIPNEPDYAELANIPRLEQTLDRLQRIYGSHTAYPIWSTEFGFITNPPNPQYTISPTLAAKYINWAEYMSWRDPRIRSYDQYLLADSATQGFASGLETPTGAKKPAYAAYLMPLFLPKTTTTKGSSLEVWGDVRPAKLVDGDKRAPVEIQFRPSSGSAWKTVAKVSSLSKEGYFDVLQTFPGSGSVRTRWADPHGQAITSRIVPITVH